MARTTTPIPPITIRPAYADDESAIIRLAALDSAPVPARPMLVGEVDGELHVALSLSDGRVIANPFERTADVVALLRLHASTERARTGGPAAAAHLTNARRRDRARRGRRRPLLVG
jgi:hypothetical protein